ncbi:PREDICTED: zinc finger BED domain-containing protein 1-like [Vollenhovia emeryi]|uniref:zinc finger BED domain-containing protein 1-like n=1 Tax=Vollenhovia emeryi TaxID=411798 RepID=UPI0005F4B1F3|nr:PREDICTED: zinc finger BED domain-containing protein 1-like [Vollenhovia emeryi]
MEMADPLEEEDEEIESTAQSATSIFKATTPTTTSHVTLKPKQPRLDESFAKQISFQSGSKATELNNKLVFMLTKDYMPIRTVQKEGFQEFVKALNPLYKLPSRKTVTDLIEEKYDYLSNLTKERLSTIESLSLTTDIWTEPLNSKSYLGLTAHYLFANKCKSITIGVQELDERHTSNNLKDWLLNLLDEWRIKRENIVAMISDNGANIKKAIIDIFGADKHIPCFAHTLNLVPSKIIETDELISPLIKKVKTIVTYFKKSVFASDQLRVYSQLKLIQSIETRWNSTYDMLFRFMELSDAISLILLKCTTAPSMLTATELQTVKEFTDLLKPFEEATKIVCGESYVTASKIIPFINILKRKLEMYVPVTDTAKHLKKTLMEGFTKRFENIEKVSIIAMATLLDPRFKKIHFLDKIACSRAIDKISKMLSTEEKQRDKELLPEVEKIKIMEKKTFGHIINN